MSEAKRDLSLFPGQYAYMQDTSKGNIKLYTGPTVITPTAQERAVVYDERKRTFMPCEGLEAAIRLSPVAVEGYYIELLNPAKDNAHPNDGSSQMGGDLLVGRKINIPGPAMFSLWPGQVATVIRGHQLNSNQYLLARVYNEEEAKKNWDKAIMKSATSTLPPLTSEATPEEKKAYESALAEEKKKQTTVSLLKPSDLTVGKKFIIRGTEVSFYIPPTGITVVPETEVEGKTVYAREALTLERLEYAVLVDESGNKRYEKGPTVVFPQPTERFVSQKVDGTVTKKFTAIEMNPIQGIHLKVTADYEEEFGEPQAGLMGKKATRKFKAGEEIFITGKDTPIYYPREEHAAIKYDGKTKHFATAVPSGEARYVMDRMSGEIKMVKGEAMLLPDPRTEIIVRRVLTDKQATLWYPGNIEALRYNQDLRVLLSSAPTTRQGVLSEGDIERGANRGGRGREEKTKGGTIAAVAAAGGGGQYLASNYMAMDQSQVSKEQGYIGDELIRQSGYNAPRTLTLDTKFQGVPTIELWTNYGVMVVSKSGGRRVEVGPQTILLEYDESLEVLELSTGKPKTTDQLIKTVYLRVENNKVADIVNVETSDHVNVELRLSYLVNFEGEKEKWFAVENYVKFLCDHVRSELKGQVRKTRIEDFYSNSMDIIRDIIIGKEKKGMFFAANNMRLADVEVLGVDIKNEEIRRLLNTSQLSVVQTNIEMSNLRRNLESTKEKEIISREEIQSRTETVKLKNELEMEVLTSHLAVSLARLANTLKELSDQKKVELEKQSLTAQSHNAKLELERLSTEQSLKFGLAQQEQKISFLKAEAESTIEKFKAVEGNFTTALLSLSHNETLVKAAEAWSIQRVIGGDNISEALQKVFAGSPLASLVKQITANGSAIEAKKDASVQPRV